MPGLSRVRRYTPLDPIELLDVFIPLVLQSRPVILLDHSIGGVFVTESIRYRLPYVIGDVGGVPTALIFSCIQPSSRIELSLPHDLCAPRKKRNNERSPTSVDSKSSLFGIHLTPKSVSSSNTRIDSPNIHTSPTQPIRNLNQTNFRTILRSSPLHQTPFPSIPPHTASVPVRRYTHSSS